MVLVFNDITRIKKLENIRRDFVANVTHELKTPITAILGAAETMIGGAIDNADDSKRFLDMIAKKSNHLNNLVDDLLVLARLESEFEHERLDLSPGKIAEVLNSSMRSCREHADSRNVDMVCICDPVIEAKINPRQLEQAIINLIENAIKYSDPGSQITIKAETTKEEIVISVEDQGCGIESKHLPRLFERFYRVDKARSRDIGGTGLGLAIVKHIALAHGGTVGVDSIPGQGSIFEIHLPLSDHASQYLLFNTPMSN
jgi:two-component system phosphate regulon sensor histidine kinase PhoR